VFKLPPAFSKNPADSNFVAVRNAIPPKPSNPAVIPAVLISTKPAEIIVRPQFAPVPETGLQSVTNIQNVLFFEPSSGRFFLSRAAGSWLTACLGLGASPATTCRWTHAAVLASVPGTSQAQLAVLQAQVPRQATLKKNTAKQNVVYAGTPRFKPIPGTTMTYAVNTSFRVIETGGKFYVCYQGAWFVGPSPNGPWLLAESVPSVIYTIPPRSPMYNVTYVKVYTATPATVTYGYTAGYTMGFVTADVLVYGQPTTIRRW
jgi:hypothetical protein